MIGEYSQNSKNDGQVVDVPGRGPEALERALKWLKRKNSNSKIFKLLKFRTANPGVEQRSRAKRQRADRARSTRDRNRQRLNTKLSKGARRR